MIESTPARVNNVRPDDVVDAANGDATVWNRLKIECRSPSTSVSYIVPPRLTETTQSTDQTEEFIQSARGPSITPPQEARTYYLGRKMAGPEPWFEELPGLSQNDHRAVDRLIELIKETGDKIRSTFTDIEFDFVFAASRERLQQRVVAIESLRDRYLSLQENLDRFNLLNRPELREIQRQEVDKLISAIRGRLALMVVDDLHAQDQATDQQIETERQIKADFDASIQAYVASVLPVPGDESEVDASEVEAMRATLDVITRSRVAGQQPPLFAPSGRFTLEEYRETRRKSVMAIARDAALCERYGRIESGEQHWNTPVDSPKDDDADVLAHSRRIADKYRGQSLFALIGEAEKTRVMLASYRTAMPAVGPIPAWGGMPPRSTPRSTPAAHSTESVPESPPVEHQAKRECNKPRCRHCRLILIDPDITRVRLREVLELIESGHRSTVIHDRWHVSPSTIRDWVAAARHRRELGSL